MRSHNRGSRQYRRQLPRPPPVEDRRIAPPSEEAQANARREVVSFFLADYAAAVYPDPQKALAEKLYLQATQTHDDPTARYVLDTEARDIAVAAGAVGLLEKVLANLGEGYRVKVQAMTVEMLAKAAKHPRDMSATNDPARIKLLVKAAKQPRDPSARRELPPTSALDMLAKTAKQLWDPAASHDLGRMALKKAADSMRRGDIDAAESLVESASEMAQRANDGPTVIQATALAKEVQERRRRSGFSADHSPFVTFSPHGFDHRWRQPLSLSEKSDWPARLPLAMSAPAAFRKPGKCYICASSRDPRIYGPQRP